MRFTITPLGSAGGRSVGAVVNDIVRYLDRPRPAAQPAGPTAEEPGPSEYYTDGSTEPGRWLGEGAAVLGLAGVVTPHDFGRVLAGRDPASGARLLTARGSAGRRPTLGVGASTLSPASGPVLYDERDAAAVLGVEPPELDALLAAGARTSIAALAHGVSGAAGRVAEPAGAYLVPAVDGAGDRWVTESELQRCEEARGEGPSADLVAAAGQPDDLLSLAEAARLAGLTTRYMRGLAARYERERAAASETGSRPRRAQLVAYRGSRRQWLVRRSDLVKFLKHRTAPAVRVGYDLTLTTEKSLGVLALLSPPSVRTSVLDAIEAGNDVAMRWLESRACSVRVKGEVVPAVGWTAASFRHLTSRALDPFPHHHNVVAAGVETADGTRHALDARGLYRHAVGASALATAEMRLRLTEHLGVRWRRSASGGWEVNGVPEPVLREFSRRRAEIDAAIAELEAAIGRTSTIEELQTVVAATRPPKEQADAADLIADWWGRAEGLGFTASDLAACTGHEPTDIEPAQRESQLFRHLTGVSGICAGGSVFTRDDLLAAMADAPLVVGDDLVPLLCPADELEALADRFLASEAVVELHPQELSKRFRRLAGEPIYTTRDILTVQQRIVESFRSGLRQGAAAVPNDTIATAVAAQRLSHQQRALVRQLCGSGHRVHCAIGRAGSGKTTAMRTAAAAWRASGYTVFGAAVKGEAARQLGAAAGIPAETVAWYLAREDPARSPLDHRSVLIVDEASTISDRDLDRLMRLASSTGATLRLVGDPAQHGAVAAGGMFRVLCEKHPGLTPQLSSSLRLQHPADRAAAEALRDGKVEEALKELQGAGHLHFAADDINLYAKLLARWWHARVEGRPHPLVERSNYRRRQLNRLAHRLLQVHGVIGQDVIKASGGRAFAVGDEVTARRGERSLFPPGEPHRYVRNGARGRVIAATNDEIVVAFDDLGHVPLPRSFFDEHRGPGGRTDVGLDHAYAVTSYAVQGATFETSTSRIDEHATRSETYVDITRGRQENHIFATRAEDPLDGERLPKAPPPPLDASITMRLAASAGEVTAWELQQPGPSAARAGQHRAGPSSTRSAVSR